MTTDNVCVDALLPTKLLWDEFYIELPRGVAIPITNIAGHPLGKKVRVYIEEQFYEGVLRAVSPGKPTKPNSKKDGKQLKKDRGGAERDTFREQANKSVADKQKWR